MLQTKKSMMRSAADAVIGEARQSSLDKASQELADEVKKLIDERNDVNRIPQDKEEDQEDKKEKEDKIEQENRKEQDDKEEKLENAEEAENAENVENAEYARTQQRL